MVEQDIKRGHHKNISGENFEQLLKDIFGDFQKEKDEYKVYYGALDPLTTYIKNKTTLYVDTTMNPDVDEETAIKTRKKFMQFLDEATGFDAKKRKKRMVAKMKKAKK